MSDGKKEKKRYSEVKINLLWVLFIGSLLVLALGKLFPEEATAVIAAGTALLGYAGAAVKELVAPSKPPPDPEEDEGLVTPKGAERLVKAGRGEE